MDDAFAYCAQLVRQADRDRYIASLFAPAPHRDALYALYAFNSEVARVREAAHQPMPGEIRLQWWREVVDGERAGEASANPVAAALLATIDRYGLATGRLDGLIEAHRFDLYDEPVATIADLEACTAETSSGLIALAANILGVDAEPAARPAGIAYGIMNLIRAFALHAAHNQLYVPIDLLQRHKVEANEIFSGKSSNGLNMALADLRQLARENLAAARERIAALPAEALAAFLPVALVRPSLDRLDRCDAFAPADLPAWRRQWLIWRAARNPARIAG
jgi:15-cis-phytoene synthase